MFFARMSKRRRLQVAFIPALILCLAPLGAGAQPISPENVPVDLKPWIRWVLADQPEHLCPAVQEQAVCIWPGVLKLEVKADGGRFEQRLYSDREIEVQLPGSPERWPQQVRIDGKPAAVLQREAEPGVQVTAGEHRIEGIFIWLALPEVLQVPANLANVALSVDGKPVAFPKRDQENKLWLKQSASKKTETEQLELKVHRRIDDGVPLTITTRLLLKAGGAAREVNLGKVLLDAHRDGEAVAAFRSFGNRTTGWMPFFAWAYPQSLFYMAVALDRLGQGAEAGALLDRLLTLWKDADPDLPLLAEAKGMQARLATAK